MFNKNPFPWHYFVRTVRARILLVTLACTFTYITCEAYPEHALPKVLIVFILLVIVALIQSYFRMLPFSHLLAKINSIQTQLPHNKKLNLIYQKNEWILIQEMLKLTEKYIGEQRELLYAQEQRSHVILESISEPIILVDSFLNCKHYNSVFKNTFIKEKKTKVYQDEKLWKIFEDQFILDLFENSKEHNQTSKTLAYKIEEDYFDISITPINDIGQNSLGLLAIFYNVTDSKLTEKMRVDFVANVSHEIRTPLTSIKGFAQLLLAQKDAFPKDFVAPLERINTNTERLKDLFDNLLQLSVIESKYELDITQVELIKLLSHVKANLKAKYRAKNIEIELPTEATINGDTKLLEHVFTNLLDNSIKYNDKKVCEIIITRDCTPDETVLTIKDNGPGINNKELQRIFERFYRIQGQSADSIEGTGLGLSIVKHIINKHRGTIEVSSEIGVGTQFTIKFPS